MYQEEEKNVVSTGIAALDEDIGGGLTVGDLSIFYGDCTAIGIFLYTVMFAQMPEDQKSKVLKVEAIHGIGIDAIKAIREMAEKGGQCVILTFYDSTYREKGDLPFEIKSAAANVFYFESKKDRTGDTLEVLKNRSHGLHDVKYKIQ